MIGFLSSLLALSLKHLTEYYETILFGKTTTSFIYTLLFPLIGLFVIYFLRRYLFNNKPNKGITEIFESTNSKKKNLPINKVASHFFNGLLTVAFGGSTGIEVSTVVASATIGSVAQQKANFFREYKTELICGGVAAGITALFMSPLAGILFALEVISRKMNKVFLLSTIIGVSVASVLAFVMDEQPMFAVKIATWHYHAIPYFILLGILAGIHSVYLTKSVIFFKNLFSKIEDQFRKIILGAMVLSLLLLILPQLYGDGYHAMADVFAHPQITFTIPLLLTFLAVLVFKPIATSITLAAGGDGGVFAPSLFLGAFLGLLFASILNTFFGANVIPLNFMVIGMAAMLSASIHAPFTALFLVCGWIGDYRLLLPILAVCLISKYTAKFIFPYTVYTISAKAARGIKITDNAH